MSQSTGDPCGQGGATSDEHYPVKWGQLKVAVPMGAVTRAARLDLEAERLGETWANPSTGMHHLIERLE